MTDTTDQRLWPCPDCDGFDGACPECGICIPCSIDGHDEGCSRGVDEPPTYVSAMGEPGYPGCPGCGHTINHAPGCREDES